MRCTHGHTFRYAPNPTSPSLALALQQSGAAAKRRPSGISARSESALSGFRSCAQSGSRDLDPKTRDATEVHFILVTHENAETEMKGSCGYLKVVRRNRIATSAQIREQIGPPLGDLTSKIHERNPSHERGEPPAPNCSAGRTARHARANEQLCIDDRRQNRGLATRADEHGVPVGTSAFHRNGRTRVDYEAQGSSGGRSAAFTRSIASANSGSGPPTELQAANASRTVVTEASTTGVTRATGSPLRSTTNESPR